MLMDMRVNPARVRVIKQPASAVGRVVYWMSRDQRAADNWALILAGDLARKHSAPLAVIFCLVDDFLGATFRAYDFMLRGLEEVSRFLNDKDIPFFLLKGDPTVQIPDFVRANNVDLLVTDFDPLRIKRRWKALVVSRTEAGIYEVDAHNVVPCWVASSKREYGAYTLRPKIQRALPEFLEVFPRLSKRRKKWQGRVPAVKWQRVSKELRVDRDVKPVDWIRPGEKAALRALRRFVGQGLACYPERRNDISLEGQSGLSPYLHFGQISAARVALEVEMSGAPTRSKEAFLEELIVRRELSDNFCFYNRNYDNVRGFPEWAARTLREHREDPREYTYSLRQLDGAATHDDLWNAAQRQMVTRGKMHGYMRMYWAKKILEWTTSAGTAMKFAILLNDRYELDGRDPNGYTGIAWSIGGVHDRAWGERHVFGKVRYMSYRGMKSKLDTRAYIEKYS
jgi:deoxyribodipyrimidine photo-lyase